MPPLALRSMSGGGSRRSGDRGEEGEEEWEEWESERDRERERERLGLKWWPVLVPVLLWARDVRFPLVEEGVPAVPGDRTTRGCAGACECDV
jgi:hypothetical protein